MLGTRDSIMGRTLEMGCAIPVQLRCTALLATLASGSRHHFEGPTLQMKYKSQPMLFKPCSGNFHPTMQSSRGDSKGRDSAEVSWPKDQCGMERVQKLQQSADNQDLHTFVSVLKWYKYHLLLQQPRPKHTDSQGQR